jgi:hypothetical protein
MVEENDVKDTQDNQENPPEETTETGAETENETDDGQTEVDEKGVPYKNRYMESQRKLSAVEERLASIEQNIRTTRQPDNTVQTPETRQNLNEQRVREFASDPDGFIDRKVAERERQRRLQEAFAYVNNNKLSVPEIDKVIVDYSISTVDPLLAAQSAHRIMQSNSKKRVSETVEKQRTENIKGKQVPSGTKPITSRQKNADVDEVMGRIKERGDPRDVTEYFRKTLTPEK